MPAPILRDVHGATFAFLGDHNVDWYWFLKIDFMPADPPGILRYTQFPGGWTDGDGLLDTAEPYTGLWEEYDFKVRGLAQTVASILEVSSLSLVNIKTAEDDEDYPDVQGEWTKRAFDPDVGLRNKPVSVWAAWWPAGDLSGPPEGYSRFFDGRVGMFELADRADLALNPHRNDQNIIVPGRENLRTCTLIYKDPECKYAGLLPDCDFTLDGPNGCKAHANEVNFGGTGYFAPEPNTSITWGKDGQKFVAG